MKTFLIIMFFVYNSNGQRVDTIPIQTDITEITKCERMAKNSSVRINEHLKKKNMTVKYACMSEDEDHDEI